MPKLLKIFLIFSIFAFGSSALAGDLEDGMRAAEKRDSSKALELYTSLAEQGDVDAKYNIGVIYLKGIGVKENHALAAKWLQVAAEQDHKHAQWLFGMMHQFGQGVPQNYQLAAAWFMKAALQNQSQAQLALGLLYAEGKGVEKDDNLAAFFFEKSATQGEPVAQRLIGLMYNNGVGVTQNYKLASKWFSLAAGQGDAQSQGQLGALYLGGLGVPKDELRGYMWMNIAVINGYSKILSERNLLARLLSKDQLSAAEDASKKCIKQKFKDCDKLIISSNLTAEDEMRDDAAKAIEIFDRDFKQTGMTGIQIGTIPDCYKKVRKGSTYRAVRLCGMIDLWAVTVDGQMSEMMKWRRNEYLTPMKFVERIKKAKAHLSAVDEAKMGEKWIDYLYDASEAKQ